MKKLLSFFILLSVTFGCKSKGEEVLFPISDLKSAFLTDLEGDVNGLTKLTEKDTEDLAEYFKELRPYNQVHKQYPSHRIRLLLIDSNQDTIIVDSSPDSPSVVVRGEGIFMFDRKRTEQQFQLKLQTLLENIK